MSVSVHHPFFIKVCVYIYVCIIKWKEKMQKSLNRWNYFIEIIFHLLRRFLTFQNLLILHYCAETS